MGERTRGRGKTEKGNGDLTVLPEKSPDAIAPQKTAGYYRGPISATLRFVKGGKFFFMDLARSAPQIEPDLSRIIEEWDRLSPRNRRLTSIDEICLLKGIDPMHFFSVVGEAAMKFRDNATLLIAALNMPEIVKKSVQVAKTTDGVDDRKMLFQHSGFIPVPQGSNTRINILNENNARAAAQSEANRERGLPSFEETMGDIESDE